HGGDVSGLAGAQQVSGPADLEVAHSDLEARPQRRGLADRAQTFVRVLGQHHLGRMETVRVGAASGASDPTPQLVQLTQTEAVGPVDNEGVDRGNVDAGFDDRRAHENVVAALPEVDDHLFESAFVHLPVGDGDARFGYEFAQV